MRNGNTELEAPARHADLLPSEMTYRCPACGAEPSEPVTLQEDNYGEFTVPAEERFILCDCGALIDIGWNGWKWHEGNGFT
jgi:hypothetical protein